MNTNTNTKYKIQIQNTNTKYKYKKIQNTNTNTYITWVEQVQYVLQDIHQPSSQSVCEWHRCHAEEKKQHA